MGRLIVSKGPLFIAFACLAYKSWERVMLIYPVLVKESCSLLISSHCGAILMFLSRFSWQIFQCCTLAWFISCVVSWHTSHQSPTSTQTHRHTSLSLPTTYIRLPVEQLYWLCKLKHTHIWSAGSKLALNLLSLVEFKRKFDWGTCCRLN